MLGPPCAVRDVGRACGYVGWSYHARCDRHTRLKRDGLIERDARIERLARAQGFGHSHFDRQPSFACRATMARGMFFSRVKIFVRERPAQLAQASLEVRQRMYKRLAERIERRV